MNQENEERGARVPEDHPEESPEGAQEVNELTEALESTLEGLNNSIKKMEEIVRSIEAGDPDWQQNIELLAEANELATDSNRRLDQVVQDVVYGSEAMEDDETDTEEGQGD